MEGFDIVNKTKYTKYRSINRHLNRCKCANKLYIHISAYHFFKTFETAQRN